jgi:hypothetical protein
MHLDADAARAAMSLRMAKQQRSRERRVLARPGRSCLEQAHARRRGSPKRPCVDTAPHRCSRPGISTTAGGGTAPASWKQPRGRRYRFGRGAPTENAGRRRCCRRGPDVTPCVRYRWHDRSTRGYCSGACQPSRRQLTPRASTPDEVRWRACALSAQWGAAVGLASGTAARPKQGGRPRLATLLPVLAPAGESFRISLAKEAPVATAGDLMLLVLSRERAPIGSRRLQVTQASRSCQKAGACSSPSRGRRVASV